MTVPVTMTVACIATQLVCGVVGLVIGALVESVLWRNRHRKAGRVVRLVLLHEKELAPPMLNSEREVLDRFATDVGS